MREIVVPTFFSLAEPIAIVLERLAEAGVRLVELHGDAPDTHIDLTDEAAVGALAKVVERLPLNVYSVHSAFSKPSEEAWDISQPDPSKRAVALRNRVQAIKAAAKLGARHITMHPGVANRSEERLAHSRAGLAQLADAARKANVRIAVENLPPDHLGGCVAEIESVLEGLDPAVVGFCLDTGHAMLGEDAVRDYISALGHRMLGIHWHTNNSIDDAHLFPDLSQSQWDDFFLALDNVGYHSPVTVEAVPPNTASLEEAVQVLRAALEGHRALRLP
jgi:D-psicose/D-tagatose/L-ribulose 3-epimerase